jgi:hypothetical protein
MFSLCSLIPCIQIYIRRFMRMFEGYVAPVSNAHHQDILYYNRTSVSWPMFWSIVNLDLKIKMYV